MKTALSNRIIPKEALTGFSRWELSALPGQAAAGATLRETDAADLREQAFDKGYQDGMQAGLAAAAEVGAAESARLGTLLASASAGMHSLGAKLARETVELALAIARQVVRRELLLRPDAVVNVVQDALVCMPQGSRDTQLHLHPLDAQLVRMRIGDDLARNGWRVVEDDRMSPGGCRVSAADGDVDATLETRWATVLAAIDAGDPPCRTGDSR